MVFQRWRQPARYFFSIVRFPNRFYFIIIFTHYRVDVVARGWRLCTSRDADYAPHQRLTSLLHAWWSHGLRGFGLRTSPGGIRRHCHHFWRLGLRSGLWRFHDVTFKETILTVSYFNTLCRFHRPIPWLSDYRKIKATELIITVWN